VIHDVVKDDVLKDAETKVLVEDDTSTAPANAVTSIEILLPSPHLTNSTVEPPSEASIDSATATDSSPTSEDQVQGDVKGDVKEDVKEPALQALEPPEAIFLARELSEEEENELWWEKAYIENYGL
jgi:hypothetical protein